MTIRYGDCGGAERARRLPSPTPSNHQGFPAATRSIRPLGMEVQGESPSGLTQELAFRKHDYGFAILLKGGNKTTVGSHRQNVPARAVLSAAVGDSPPWHTGTPHAPREPFPLAPLGNRSGMVLGYGMDSVRAVLAYGLDLHVRLHGLCTRVRTGSPRSTLWFIRCVAARSTRVRAMLVLLNGAAKLSTLLVRISVIQPQAALPSP